MAQKQSLFNDIGGLKVMQRVHTRFYDKIYAHPWLKEFFKGHNQQTIELRQTQFMAEKMGANIEYPGMALELAHRRMYIPIELLKVRQSILRESLEEEGIAEELINRWLKIDHAFWHHISNKSLKSFANIDLKYERPLIVEKP